MERREFFYAAIGFEAKTAFMKKPERTLKNLIDMMEKIHLPIFIHDQYADIIAANAAIIDLLNIPNEFLTQARLHPVGYNVMFIIFDKTSGYSSTLGDKWHQRAIENVQFFRRISLRYRNTKYFRDTFECLQKNKFFRAYWHLATLEDDQDKNSILYQYRHPSYGELKYLANISTEITSVGELYSVIYIPVSDSTREVFDSVINKSGTQFISFSTWPVREQRNCK